jgi:hypothetical protein
VADLLAHTLGEEESADHLLTAISKPLIQQAALDDMGGSDVNLDSTPRSQTHESRRKKTVAK